MMDKAVYNFFEEQLRPFSVNDVTQSLKDIGKSTLQKTLDKLVENEQLIEKCYGKQKVYCLKQGDGNGSDPNRISDELQEMDRKINEVSINLKETEEKYTVQSSELKKLENQLTLEEARSQKNKLVEHIDAIKLQLQIYSENSTPISHEDRMLIYGEHDKYTKEYRKRKRICMEMINAVLEGYPKTKQHLYEEVGIETDEDAGFRLATK